MKYVACVPCQQARAEGRFEEVVDCRTCKGKGFYRDHKSYLCNKCGGSMCPETTSANSEIPHGLVEAEVVGGYESPHLSDCTGYRFSMCEKCLRELFATFKVDPEVRHYSIGVRGDKGDVRPYSEDVEWYNFVQWRDSGGQEAKLATGICNYRESCQAPAEWHSFCSGYMSAEAVCSEHKAVSGYGNTLFIPAKEVAGIPHIADNRTREQTLKLANVWLRVKSRGDNVVTHHRYLSDCLLDATGTEQDTTGGLWYPNSTKDVLTEVGGAEFGAWVAKEIQSLGKLSLPDGTLVFGEVEHLQQIAARGLNRGIVAARILDGIPEEDGEY